MVYALHVKSSSQYCASCLLSINQCPLFRCSKCKRIFYCSRVCQKSHWASHKCECSCIVSSGTFPTATIRLLFNIISSKVKIYEGNPFLESLVSRESILLRFYVSLDVEELTADNDTRVIMEQAYAMLVMFSNKNLCVSKPYFFRLFGKAKINAFQLTNESGDEIGVALFERSAKLDHSCSPNADFAFIGKRIKVIASEEILDVSQIRISYVDLLASMKKRREELSDGYFFLCNCTRCSDLELDELCLAGLSVSIFICNCAPMLGEVKTHCYISVLGFSTDAVELYKACAAADITGNNEYLRLVYKHQDSLPLLRLCRTMVLTYKVNNDNVNGMRKAAFG
ncbi:unnamed protein product [Hydatigera taeniaeformis]|uniref:MYND-type domain-containing protein n=1 Tax=Hydatigena taeniaeformis TaxID=6205 RepID=A0A3P7F8I7_HYDTA|nr:unnamed protein product [Hydatigera taeniaeformis]